MKIGNLLLWLSSIMPVTLHARQSQPTTESMHAIIPGFLAGLDKKVSTLSGCIDKQTEKYLARLLKKELRLKRKLARKDAASASILFDSAAVTYDSLLKSLGSQTGNGSRSKGIYFPYMDSAKAALSFLQQKGDIIKGVGTSRVAASLSSFNALNQKFNQTDQIKAFILVRKQALKAALSRMTGVPPSLTRSYMSYCREIYYYSDQMSQYKQMIENPDKLLPQVLSLLNKLPAFKQFLNTHSELATLFSLPASYDNAGSIAGLQTRSQVQQLLQTQLSSAGPNVTQALQQNLAYAQSQLSMLKEKINKAGGADGLDEKDFKPNNQHTKTFWKRLEYGTNLQTVRAGNYFPTTTDLGLSVGYRFSDKTMVGIGSSYKIGWGSSIQHIAVSSQGAGLRSFMDVKIKGTFFASGGFEYNYQPVSAVSANGTDLTSLTTKWQQGGLVGISKIVAAKTKVFKKTKLQLFWDFLSYQQRPRTQAIKFRVGYNF